MLSRLFAPEDYGLLAMFTSVQALLLAFCTWRFDWSVPNARTGRIAGSLLFLGGLILVAVCALLTFAILLATSVEWSEESLFARLGALIWFMPVALLGGGLRLLLSG